MIVTCLIGGGVSTKKWGGKKGGGDGNMGRGKEKKGG